MPPLRIAVDGRCFVSPAGGVRRYITELSRAMLAIAPDLQLLAIGAGSGNGLPAGVVGVPAAGLLPTNFGWCLEGLPRAIRRMHIDVFHAPAYTAPLWGVRPLVCTIHDVSYENRPEWYPYKTDRARRWFYRRSALTADLIITDSEFSRREIEAAYGLTGDRIKVIPLGVGPPFVPGAAPSQRRTVNHAPVILHVGDLHPRRNVAVLIEAVARLRKRADSLKDARLVLAGIDRGAGKSVVNRARMLGVLDAVSIVHPDDQGIVALMQQADVFAYPSLYEGFGLPVLEAMACGAPVIASSWSSLPEVVGGAGLLIPPDDVGQWYDALVEVLESERVASDLQRSGFLRAAEMSWQRAAAETLRVYRHLC